VTWRLRSCHRNGLCDPGKVHRFPDLRIAHEPGPDPAGSRILRREERYPKVDADDIRVRPAVHWMERIREPVPVPYPRPYRSRMYIRVAVHILGSNISDPPGAQGTSVPSIGPSRGGPPQATYRFAPVGLVRAAWTHPFEAQEPQAMIALACSAVSSRMLRNVSPSTVSRRRRRWSGRYPRPQGRTRRDAP